MNAFFKPFNLKHEKENYRHVVSSIEKDVAFHGANLWILIFAIFVASLGLNTNSAAVTIGAMLISPLMGPIMGLGLSMGINDLMLLRKSLFNYFFAAGVGLATSTLYFRITPLNVAHSEILARISPNIYDVLIAFFGGLAGIIAMSGKYKGNVIPGVAIATALMPPLCTAGYGLATLQMTYFFGAFYLFLINTVFIALATLLTVRLLRFPYKDMPNLQDEIKAKRIIWVVAVLTLLPSLYLGYEFVLQENFTQSANRFIQNEAHFSNDYLLEKSINAGQKTITLVYGGKKITETEIEQLKKKLAYYNLEHAKISVRQGFEYMSELKQPEQIDPLKKALTETENDLLFLRTKLDSIESSEKNADQLIQEARSLYPGLNNIAITLLHSVGQQASGEQETYLVYMQFTNAPGKKEIEQAQNWLETKLHKKAKVIFD